MKNPCFHLLILLLIFSLCLPNVYSQDSSNWHLPEGAIARIGKGNIRKLAFSSDGNTLAIATDIGIWLYDTHTHQERALLGAHTEKVRDISFSSKDNILAAGIGKNIILWNAITGTEIKVFSYDQSETVSCVAFSPDGNTLASGIWHNKNIVLWDITTGKQEIISNGYINTIVEIDFSTDGNTLVSRGYGKTHYPTAIQLWDVSTGKSIRKLNEYEKTITDIAVSPDGKTLIAASKDEKRRLTFWDINKGIPLTFKPKLQSRFTQSLAINPDGSILAIGGLGSVSLRNATTAELMTTHNGHNGFVISVAFSPGGSTLASATDHEVLLWDITGALPITTINTNKEQAVNCVSISPIGDIIASGQSDGTVFLWDAVIGEKKSKFSADTGRVNSIAFTPDGNMLAVGTQGAIHLWNIETDEIATLYTKNIGEIQSVTFSPDGRTLAGGGDYRTIVLWDVATRERKKYLRGHTDRVNSIVFSPDGKTVASTGVDRQIIIWDRETGTQKSKYNGHLDDVTCLVFSPDGTTLASGDRWGQIVIKDLSLNDHSNIRTEISLLEDIAFSPDGKSLAIASDDGIHLCDANTSKITAAFIGHTMRVKSVAFSPHGGTIVSGGWDRTVRVWNSRGGQLNLITTNFIESVVSVAFSPDGNTLATTGAKHSVRLWNAQTGQHDVSFGNTSSAQSIAFSPDGKVIATGKLSNGIELWETSTGKQIANYKGHSDSLESVAFSPDGKTLASASRDKRNHLMGYFNR